MILRHVALRIELHRHAGTIDRLLPVRVVVNVEAHLRAGLHQLAGAFGKDVAVLADGVLVEERLGLLLPHVVLSDELFVFGDVLNEIRQQVMHDRARAGPRLGLDSLHVAIFGEAAVGDVIDPHVRTARGNDMRLRNLDDEIGLADVPDIVVFELPWRRHVGHVALLRALVDPRRDRRDLLLGQRGVVLEFLNADVALDVPRRHQARDRLCLDRSRVRPRVFIRNQRHRRVRFGPVAVLARALKNRRDVLRERDSVTVGLSAVAPGAEAGLWAFGTTVIVMTSAADAIARALMPASTFLADLKVGTTGGYFSLFTLAIFSASNDL